MLIQSIKIESYVQDESDHCRVHSSFRRQTICLYSNVSSTWFWSSKLIYLSSGFEQNQGEDAQTEYTFLKLYLALTVAPLVNAEFLRECNS